MKILVAIANYGTQNDRYLARILSEYGSMAHEVDIVVCSNVRKTLGPDIRLVVGLPTKDPWSLPFAHKRILADRADDYDLFIYSEDDVLITEGNIRAFLDVTRALPETEIAGFIRSETGSDGEISYCEFHWNYHWDPASVSRRDAYTLAFFTNEHAACYMLTREQLRRAIDSGGFLVGPHAGKYDLACTAATDPYTQCGLKKMVCISRLDDFTVSHLSNKYAGKLGVSGADLRLQVETLLKIGQNGHRPASLFPTESKLAGLRYSKAYYEPVREDIAQMIPATIESVLSIGCGWGAMEGCLAKKGLRVTAVPLDPVIGACAEARGVEVIQTELEEVMASLKGRRFGCLLVSNVLHLVGNPAGVLSAVTALLTRNSLVVAVVPNLSGFAARWRRLRGDGGPRGVGEYDISGVHLTSPAVLRRWFQTAGARVERVVNILPGKASVAHGATLGLADPWLASEIVALGKTV